MNYKLLSRILRYSETTEDEFHKLLDENPEDHQTRMVFADWLQEKGDPRAEGYRALGRLGKRPTPYDENGSSKFGVEDAGREFKPAYWTYWGYGNNNPKKTLSDELPYSLLNPLVQLYPSPNNLGSYSHHPTRREAEDAAALEFGKLPPEEKEQILKHVN